MHYFIHCNNWHPIVSIIQVLNTLVKSPLFDQITVTDCLCDAIISVHVIIINSGTQFVDLDRSRFLDFIVGIYSAVSHASLVSPGVDVGAWLARTHVSYTTLVPQVADLGVSATLWPLLKTKYQ